MKITHTEVPIRELVTGYTDDGEGGVRGYSDQLDIRPPYQRELVYKEDQQRAVLDTVMRDLPLNTMYWVKDTDAVTGEIGYEVLDGQQRTLSICRFITGGFSIKDRHGAVKNFGSLPADLQGQILDYPLSIYVCEGSDSERLEWFRTINVAGEKLTDQELLNANYPGAWLTDAKRFFSKPGGPAAELAEGLIKGSAIRQELLEKVLGWMAAKDGLSGGDAYMAEHQDDRNASAMKTWYKAMIDWVTEYFPVRRKPMLGLDWGRLYLEHGDRTDLDASELEAKVAALMADDEIGKKAGIYEYVLRQGVQDNPANQRLLNLRSFTEADKATLYARQGGKCAKPSLTGHDPDEVFEQSKMEADHEVAWSQGGRTDLPNGQMLCKACNREKSDD